MAYTPKTWTLGDYVTSADLNHIETQFDEAYDYLLIHTHDSQYYSKAEARANFWHTENDGEGSGADADLIYHPDGNKHAEDFAGLGIPSGLIIWWGRPRNTRGLAYMRRERRHKGPFGDRFIVGAGPDSGYSVRRHRHRHPRTPWKHHNNRPRADCGGNRGPPARYE